MIYEREIWVGWASVKRCGQMETRCLTFISEADRANRIKRQGAGEERDRQADNGAAGEHRRRRAHAERGAGGSQGGEGGAGHAGTMQIKRPPKSIHKMFRQPEPLVLVEDIHLALTDVPMETN